jgi:hypothetical protein
MLEESIPASLVDASWEQTIRRILAILLERKKVFARTRPDVTSLIGLRQVEQFLHNGLVGRLGLPPGVQLERKLAARREVARIVDFLQSDPSAIRIGVISDNMPDETFQIFEEAEAASVAVSPFRLGELPNIRTGIATITTAPDAVNMYRAMIDRLWTDAAQGKEAAELLQTLLDRF